MKSLLFDVDNFLKNDNFTPESIGNMENWVYFSKLSVLKEQFKAFLLEPIVATPEEILDKTKMFIIQIQRLRLVIQPHFKMVKQIHLNDRVYMLVRANWITDEGVSKRMVTKAIGRVYPKDIKQISMKEASEAIMPALRKKYKESEETFGNVI